MGRLDTVSAEQGYPEPGYRNPFAKIGGQPAPPPPEQDQDPGDFIREGDPRPAVIAALRWHQLAYPSCSLSVLTTTRRRSGPLRPT